VPVEKALGNWEFSHIQKLARGLDFFSLTKKFSYLDGRWWWFAAGLPSPWTLTCNGVFHHFPSPAVSLGSSLSPFTRPSSVSAQREDSQHPLQPTAPLLTSVLPSHLGQSAQPSTMGDGDDRVACRQDASLVLSGLRPARCSGDRGNAKSEKG